MKITTTDHDVIDAITEAINATVALERSQSALGDARKRPRYERAIQRLLTVTLRRAPTASELARVLE